MDKESLTWAAVSTLAALAFKDNEFLANLIESHKNGTAVPPSTPLPNPDGKKRAKIEVTPAETPIAFPSFFNTPERQAVFTEMMQKAARCPDPTDAQAKTAAEVNTTAGNKYKSAAWANSQLAPMREANWVCTSGPGISSYYKKSHKGSPRAIQLA